MDQLLKLSQLPQRMWYNTCGVRAAPPVTATAPAGWRRAYSHRVAAHRPAATGVLPTQLPPVAQVALVHALVGCLVG